MLSIFAKPQPADIVRDLADALPKAMRNDLVSIVLYGANGLSLEPSSLNQTPQSELIRILIVLESVDPQALDRLSNVYRQISGNRRIAPMVMTLDEMHSSTDVFPITFLEMQRNYRVLAGADVLADLPIRFGHLRLRCEQELKNLLLRMQNRYLTQHDDRKLKQTFRNNYQSFMRTIGAALLLVGETCPASDEQVIREAAESFSLDGDLVERVEQAYSSNSNLPREILRGIYAALMELVSSAAIAIDQLPEQVTLLDVLDDGGQ